MFNTPTHTPIGMGGKGIPLTRHANVAQVTSEAKRVLLRTRNWDTTKEHIRGFIKVKYGLSRTTVADYIDDVYFRLQGDPEAKEFL